MYIIQEPDNTVILPGQEKYSFSSLPKKYTQMYEKTKEYQI